MKKAMGISHIKHKPHANVAYVEKKDIIELLALILQFLLISIL